MAPERISGQDYSYESDVWALGCTLWECSAGEYPYGTPPAHDAPPKKAGGTSSLLPEESRGGGLSFWDLLHAIVECEPPPLPAGRFSPALCELVADCMHQDGTKRPSTAALLAHPWLQEAAKQPGGIGDWLVPDDVAG